MIPLSEAVLITMGLLTVAIIAAGLCRTLPIPYTVILVILGMGLGELGRSWEPMAILHELRLSPDLVFFIFLPALIFESGLNLDARQLVKDLAPVLVMAIPALLISTLFIGFGLSFLLGMEPVIALVFGALISATDPVAVVALFKELGAPLRLNVMVEGESLLNDATAIVLFSIILGLAVSGDSLGWSEVGSAVIEFARVFLGGALIGVLAGFIVSELLHRLHSTVSAVLTMSVVTAYASFTIAEHTLHVSGVMAAATAAVTLGVYGVTRLQQEVTEPMHELWEFIALVCNSLLFILVGLSVEPVNLVGHFGQIMLAVALVLVARAMAVYTLVPATIRLFSLPRVSLGERHIMWWGGLKGGLAIAIVLSIPEDMAGRQLLIDMTLGVVLFTLLVNAPSIRPLMSRLGLDRLTDDEKAEVRRGLSSARNKADDVLESFRGAGLISRTSYHRASKAVHGTLRAKAEKIGAEQRARGTYLLALRTELETLSQLYDMGVISQYTYLDVRNTLYTDRERHSGDEGPVNGGKKGGVSPFLRLEMAMLRRLREHDWAARLLSRYQDQRLTQHLQHNIAGILICQAVLARLDVAEEVDVEKRDELKTLYENRLKRREGRVASIREDFPGFYERFESRLCAKVALNSARLNAEHGNHHGELGGKAFSNISRRIDEGLEGLPPVSESLPGLTAKELIEMVTLLAGLPEQALDAMAAHARPVTFLPGDIIIGEGDKGNALYIITHGKVSVYKGAGTAEEKLLGELGLGDFFGETALLGDNVRTATAKANTASTLLRLTRKDVMQLAEHHPEVHERLEEASAARKAQVS